MNLVVNARDAMPNGGRLTIATMNACVREGFTARHSWVPAGDYVALTVTDTGVGMEHAVQDHLFEPFFTTKEEGKGTGLGLATVYGIVHQSNGHVWADSEPGRGACFTIYLAATKTVALEPVSEPAEQNPRGTETLLIVEDEISLHGTLVHFLVGRGYTVLAARSPREALDISDRYDSSIDLLVTDVVMPGMKGTQLSLELRQRRPAIKTIFMSGYIDDAVVRCGLSESSAIFLQKPFSVHALAQKVREVIANNTPVAVE